jgi:hypothetical protein
MAKLQGEIDAHDQALADPALFRRAPAEAADRTKARADLAARLAEVETRWIEAAHAIEAIESQSREP